MSEGRKLSHAKRHKNSLLIEISKIPKLDISNIFEIGALSVLFYSAFRANGQSDGVNKK